MSIPRVCVCALCAYAYACARIKPPVSPQTLQICDVGVCYLPNAQPHAPPPPKSAGREFGAYLDALATTPPPKSPPALQIRPATLAKRPARGNPRPYPCIRPCVRLCAAGDPLANFRTIVIQYAPKPNGTSTNTRRWRPERNLN